MNRKFVIINNLNEMFKIDNKVIEFKALNEAEEFLQICRVMCRLDNRYCSSINSIDYLRNLTIMEVVTK